METQKQKRDVYAIVTERIIEQLEKGLVPWKKPWSEAGLPQNLTSKRPYRGINVWLLSELGFERNYFLTFKSLKELGGSIKEGEKGFPVVYWNWRDVTDEDSGESKLVPFLRYYVVFNIAQCEGIPSELIPEVPLQNTNAMAECEAVIEGMPNRPTIKHRKNQAYYHPFYDYVNLPKKDSFADWEGYYGVLFHELIHSTGHISRLNRKELMQMAEHGSDEYSIEELIAEMGTCFLMSLCGFKDLSFNNNAAYINGWLAKLKNDKSFVIYAASKAQQAVDFILNVKVKEQEDAKVEQVEQSNGIPFEKEVDEELAS